LTFILGFAILNNMRGLILQILSATLGFWLAIRFIEGVNLQMIPGESFLGFQLTEQWHVLLVCGAILGIINFFIKPILKVITSPLRILTFGLFGIVINMAMVWIVDVLFTELTIDGLVPLFWTTIILWIISLILGVSQKRN